MSGSPGWFRPSPLRSGTSRQDTRKKVRVHKMTITFVIFCGHWILVSFFMNPQELKSLGLEVSTASARIESPGKVGETTWRHRFNVFSDVQKEI